ncbi:MAG TPA: glycosyltransferase [Mycobacteriales bacterium]|nr:glycosyltransferase [Mycobacteriales bacterium]
MRIAHVSAHFPPDFVSGGTLVPLRVAAGLRARGHDVRVFAGDVHSGRPPLSEWDSEVEGLPVRVVSIGAFIDWAARENVDNPGVAEAFARWLRAHPADVVHLHSLQTFGGDLVRVAKESGARVVVTMHDFWWFCARQFLVAPDERPCGLVVDCSACPCEVDRPWLEERNAWLAARLVHADLVLAPSASAARVLVANGVDPARLRVDENGADDALPPPADPVPSTGEVRLLFAGGPNPMKGLPVLLRAAERLAGLPGWRLDAYGAPAATRPGLPVQGHPPYRPEDLPDVLARHDVLVLPSLARETYSLQVREALAAGLAVVCTDVPGPEEVVEDGVNGLVVPAGDDVVLADALRRLVEEPGLLQRLRAGAPGVRQRTTAEQVDGLEAAYEALLAGDRPVLPAPVPDLPADLPRAVRSVVIGVGIGGASLRYRARLAAEGLAEVGVDAQVRHYRDPELLDLARTADAVVLYRVPATRQVLALTEAVKARPEPVPLVFDVDDLIFDEDLAAEIHGLAHLPQAEQDLWWQGVRRYRTTMEACDAYIGSTQMLCDHAAAVTGMPTARWANGVGRLLAQVSDAELARERAPGPVRLGYFSGTDTHDRDWAEVEPAVVEVLRRHPQAELWLGGLLRPGAALDELGDRVRRLPFVPWQQLCASLRDVDVNLAPLQLGGRFNEAKSAIKWLEAALVATPTVASPSQPFREAVRSGENGLLAATPDEWVAALDRLLADPAERRRLGERARRDALLELGPHVQGRRYAEVLEQARARVAAEGHRVSAGRFRAEALDEPWEPTPLEPYSADVRAVVVRPPAVPRPLWRRAAGRARRVAGRARRRLAG